MDRATSLKKIIWELLDNRDYDAATKKLESELFDFFSLKVDDSALLCQIAGSYISLGQESENQAPIAKGIGLLKDNHKLYENQFGEINFNFNLGNGYSALHGLSIKKGQNYFPKPENLRGEFFEAKQHFLRAYKKISHDESDISFAVMTNLGINYKHCGRFVEALQLFDTVLQSKPDSANAMVSKAYCLTETIQAAQLSKTKSLFAEIYWLYYSSHTKGPFPPGLEEHLLGRMQKTKETLEVLDYNFDNLDKDVAESDSEFHKHPEDLKFYLGNFLSLSEHGLYCKCNSAKIDDLMIGADGMEVGKKMAHLEILLNQIKSEFSLARTLLYQYASSESTDNVYYQKFGQEGLMHGLQVEKLRSAFRLSFGILDKIANGIFYLFDLPKKERESLYFESCWNKPKEPARWQAINAVDNIHLTALYSIACDLVKDQGEFGYYKSWRNQMEHGAFSILAEPSDKSDLTQNDLFHVSTYMEDFEYKTMHLLQLVRAAIFSFAFCARTELKKS